MTPKKQRIIITGGGGFIGSSLAKELDQKGYSNVLKIDKFPSVNGADKKYAICDISDVEKLQNIIQKGDVIIHLASSIIPATSEANIKKDIEENLLGTISLLEVCRAKKIKKFIYLSSGGTVYGNTDKKKSKETDVTNPKGFYGVLKLSIEKYLEVYGHIYGMKYTIIRLGNAFGRKDTGNKNVWAVDNFLQKILNNEACVINGDGNIVRDYIYIDDVTNFITRVISDDNINGIINLGTGKGTSVNEIISTIEKVSGKKALVKHSKGKKADVPYNVLDISKLKALGWKPQYDLKKAIEDLCTKRK